MRARYQNGVTIRTLRDGDTVTVAALFERLGPGARLQRFGGAKPRLTAAELEALSLVDGDHHVLVAHVDGDPRPAGIARLARLPSEARAAEVACAVADVYQGRGIGSLLSRSLAADARAAGLVEIHATVSGDNPRALSLLTRCKPPSRVAWRGGVRELVVSLR